MIGTTVSCRICSGKDLKTGNLAKEPYKILECSNCGVWFLDPQPETFSAAHHYDSNYYADWENTQKARRTALWKERLRGLIPYVRGKKLLDIGAGTGLFMSTAKNEGFEVHGTEISVDACKLAENAYGIKIFNGDLLKAGFEDNSFDVITIWHVLEHLTDPMATIREVYRILKPGGIFLLALPNLNNYFFRLMYPVVRRKKYLLFTPEDREQHFFYFNGRALRNMLELGKFNVLKIAPDLGQVSSGKRILDFMPYLFYAISGIIFTDAIKAVARK
ncbi:MAG: methyltransferase domain-containing protein [Elusimicrobiota bacterium]